MTSPRPRRLLKVAMHLLDRRGVPSSKEGIKNSLVAFLLIPNTSLVATCTCSTLLSVRR